MVSSAVYRYFPSRDDLLTALIVDAYDAVGAAAEAGRSPRHRRRGAVARAGSRVTGAVRAWALANPHEYALDLRQPGARATPRRRTRSTPRPASSLALLRIVVDGVAVGRDRRRRRRPSIAARRARRLRRAPRAWPRPACPTRCSSRTLLVWPQLFGSISLEMFGHLHNVIHDYDAFFTLQMRRTAEFLVNGT